MLSLVENTNYDCVFIGCLDKIKPSSLSTASSPIAAENNQHQNCHQSNNNNIAIDSSLLSDHEKQLLERDLFTKLLPYRCVPVYIESNRHHDFYEGYCKTGKSR
jgi:hypothetical protein